MLLFLLIIAPIGCVGCVVRTRLESRCLGSAPFDSVGALGDLDIDGSRSLVLLAPSERLPFLLSDLWGRHLVLPPFGLWLLVRPAFG